MFWLNRHVWAHRDLKRFVDAMKNFFRRNTVSCLSGCLYFLDSLDCAQQHQQPDEGSTGLDENSSKSIVKYLDPKVTMKESPWIGDVDHPGLNFEKPDPTPEQLEVIHEASWKAQPMPESSWTGDVWKNGKAWKHEQHEWKIVANWGDTLSIDSWGAQTCSDDEAPQALPSPWPPGAESGEPTQDSPGSAMPGEKLSSQDPLFTPEVQAALMNAQYKFQATLMNEEQVLTQFLDTWKTDVTSDTGNPKSKLLPNSLITGPDLPPVAEPGEPKEVLLMKAKQWDSEDGPFVASAHLPTSTQLHYQKHFQVNPKVLTQLMPKTWQPKGASSSSKTEVPVKAPPPSYLWNALALEPGKSPGKDTASSKTWQPKGASSSWKTEVPVKAPPSQKVYFPWSGSESKFDLAYGSSPSAKDLVCTVNSTAGSGPPKMSPTFFHCKLENKGTVVVYRYQDIAYTLSSRAEGVSQKKSEKNINRIIEITAKSKVENDPRQWIHKGVASPKDTVLFSCEDCKPEWLREGWECRSCGCGVEMHVGQTYNETKLDIPKKKRWMKSKPQTLSGSTCPSCKKEIVGDMTEMNLHLNLRLCHEKSSIAYLAAYIVARVQSGVCTHPEAHGKKNSKWGIPKVNFDVALTFVEKWQRMFELYFIEGGERVSIEKATENCTPRVVYHWSPHGNVETIDDNGLKGPNDPGYKMKTDNGYYGKGIYVSPSFSKYKQYGYGNDKYAWMLLALVGRMFPAIQKTEKSKDLRTAAYDCHVNWDMLDGAKGAQIVLQTTDCALPIFTVNQKQHLELQYFVETVLVPAFVEGARDTFL